MEKKTVQVTARKTKVERKQLTASKGMLLLDISHPYSWNVLISWDDEEDSKKTQRKFKKGTGTNREFDYVTSRVFKIMGQDEDWRWSKEKKQLG